MREWKNPGVKIIKKKKIKRCSLCNQPLSRLEIKCFKSVCDKCKRTEYKKKRL